MVGWECPTNPREASGLDPEAVHLDENLHIQEMSEDARSDAKLKMTTDKATIDEIADAENPAAAFRDAVENDDVVIAGEDGQILEQVKWAVLNFLKGILL